MALTTLVLDIGGVVIPTLFEVLPPAGLPPGPFGTDPRYEDVESGRLQERDYWAEVARSRPELDVGAAMRTTLGVREEIGSMLTDLGGRVRLAGLTNDMAHWFGDQWPTRFPELAHFEDLLEARRSGMLKPDPSVFRWAVAQLRDVQTHECLFVDDLPSNLRGAAAAGMATEWFDVTDPAGSVRRVLERLGLLPEPAPQRHFRPG